MITRIYVRASTKDQDATRALPMLESFADGDFLNYVENFSGTKLNRPILNQLLEDSNYGDILLVESVDRLSRLTQDDFGILKQKIKSKGLKLVIHDLPTTHINNATSDNITNEILNVINAMLIDLLATMARLDNEKRKERIKQGLERSGHKSKGKKPNVAKHQRIKELLQLDTMTIGEIANAMKCGEATVYRVKKTLASNGS